MHCNNLQGNLSLLSLNLAGNHLPVPPLDNPIDAALRRNTKSNIIAHKTALMMAFHPRLGGGSVVFHSFKKSPIGDLHVLRCVWEMLWAPVTTPTQSPSNRNVAYDSPLMGASTLINNSTGLLATPPLSLLNASSTGHVQHSQNPATPTHAMQNHRNLVQGSGSSAFTHASSDGNSSSPSHQHVLTESKESLLQASHIQYSNLSSPSRANNGLGLTNQNTYIDLPHNEHRGSNNGADLDMPVNSPGQTGVTPSSSNSKHSKRRSRAANDEKLYSEDTKVGAS
jgi:hypothetical protein